MYGRNSPANEFDFKPADVFHADIAELSPMYYKSARKPPRIRFSDKYPLNIQRRKTPRKRGYLFFFYVPPRSESVKQSKYADYEQTSVYAAACYMIQYRLIQRLYLLTINTLSRILPYVRRLFRRLRIFCSFRPRRKLLRSRLFSP